MLQRIYLTKESITKQYNWFFIYTETCTKSICKIKIKIKNSYVHSILKLHKLTNLTLSVFLKSFF